MPTPKTPIDAVERRRLAEAKLAEEKGRQGEPQVDALRLLHELQVHQIELGLQNEALQESLAEVDAQLQRYSDLYDFAPVGYFTLESDGAIRELNLSGAQLLGAERAQLVGRRFGVFVAETSRPTFFRFLGAAFATKTKRTCDVELALEGRSPLAVTIDATLSPDGRECRAVVSDLTERKRAHETEAAAREHAVSQEQLRALAGRLLAVREEEGRRIARDVHDVLGQALTGLKLDLTWLGHRVTGGGKTTPPEVLAERCHAMVELVDGALTAVRRIATELRPAVLDDLGIEAALEWQAGDFQRRTGIDVDIEVPEAPTSIGTDQATAFFRIAQEALTNVARHAHATRVTIRLNTVGVEASLLISDDGRGLPRDTLAREGALGLVGMRERAGLLGGSVDVSGIEGIGTTVVARLPLRRDVSQ